MGSATREIEMLITAILPVSRVEYLDRVLEALMNQTRLPDSLLVIYDGDDKDFIEVRNKVVGLELKHVLCAKSNNARPAFAIVDRRVHIVNIHNQIRELIEDVDWVFSFEDDGIIPPDAISKLLQTAKKENVGMVTGVELGRWGVPYVGAWTADDIHDPKLMQSLRSRAEQPVIVEEVDACGLYCALIRTDKYKEHEFYTRNGLGPDVNLGLFLRQQGLQNYIDWSVHVTHLTSKQGIEIEIPATDRSHVVKLKLLNESTWKAGI